MLTFVVAAFEALMQFVEGAKNMRQIELVRRPAAGHPAPLYSLKRMCSRMRAKQDSRWDEPPACL